MLALILAIYVVSLVFTTSIEGAPAVATGRQFLPTLPGYIPVYIRAGDTPLEEINPDLAEAFNGYSSKHARKAFNRSNNAISDKTEDAETSKSNTEISSEDDLSGTYAEETTQKVEVIPVEVVHSGYQHVQKIHRD